MGLVTENVGFLRQGVDLLQQLDDEHFEARPPGLDSGGIGPQFRHVIDCYRCFLRDLPTGRVDYDRRERDPAVESDRDRCLRALRAVAAELDALDVADPDAALRVKTNAHPTTPADEVFTPSSVARELQFLASHTIHHYALIAVTLHGRGFAPDAEFGVAPSTLAYWKKAAEMAR